MSQEYLRDRSKVQQLVQLFDPLVRVVDGFAGERVSMRVGLYELMHNALLFVYFSPFLEPPMRKLTNTLF